MLVSKVVLVFDYEHYMLNKYQNFFKTGINYAYRDKTNNFHRALNAVSLQYMLNKYQNFLVGIPDPANIWRVVRDIIFSNYSNYDRIKFSLGRKTSLRIRTSPTRGEVQSIFSFWLKNTILYLENSKLTLLLAKHRELQYTNNSKHL